MSEAASTATAIARVRADEALLPAAERLFSDSHAAHFVAADEAPEITERMLSVPYLRESVRLRTRFIDDTIREALAAGIRQIAILGAGFDCRGLRLGEIAGADAIVYEVDFAAQLERKRRILTAAGVALPARVRAVPCDLALADFDAALVADLAAGGFRRDEGALFVLEGVVGYLEDTAIDRTLRLVARAGGRNAWLVLNYQTFRFRIEEFAERLKRAGLRTVRDIGCDALHPRWLGGEAPELSRFFRLAVARTAEEPGSGTPSAQGLF
jgi:methyltransferase (TIGR00027 family)